MSGFPDDDMNALQQMCGDSSNLDIFYANQFVEKEQMESLKNGVGDTVKYILEYTPLLKGTICGTIKYAGVPVQAFAESYGGVVTLTKIGQPELYVTEMSIKHVTGEITARWNKQVAHAHGKLVVSYEYNMEVDGGISLKRLVDDGYILEMPPYPYQFVQNEMVHGEGTTVSKEISLELDRSPILPRTMKGILYVNGFAIQTFLETADGIFEFMQIDQIDPNAFLQWYATGIKLHHKTGILQLQMKNPVEYRQVKLCVSYEYIYSRDPADWPKEWRQNEVTIE